MKKIRAAVKKVCEAVSDKKGDEIAVLDVSGISSFTDFLIICHGHNPKQNQAICDAVRDVLKNETELIPHHVEGYRNADWILMDYLDFMIHVFLPPARQFYRLERLWSDGVEIEPEALSA